ncbi:MAG: MobF family relaxase [Leucobacter sp.]
MTLIGANRNAWGYLMESVSTEHTIDRAEGKAAYYMANGTPPGAWAGSGLTGLDLANGAPVDEAHLVALFGDGVHPITGRPLGRRFNTPRTVEERVVVKLAEAATDPANADLTLEQFEQLGNEIREEVMNTPEKQSVAGFEFVFSPPKSVSSWWALADPTLKDEIRQAHHAAIQATIEKLETDIVRTRLGADGVAQAHVRGISAAKFDHWDSRDGDPQLHTHMLVSNRVQGEDGRWRTIDSRWALMPAVATAGAYYDGVLMDELSARFGVDWTVDEVLEDPEKYQRWLVDQARPDTTAAQQKFAIDQGTGPGSVKWQIDGVPASLNSEYSTRSTAIRREKDRLIKEFQRIKGRSPSTKEIIQIRQRATLCTRQKKKHRTLRELTQSWRQRALAHVGDSFLFADRIRELGAGRKTDLPLWSFRQDDVDDTAARDAAEFVLHTLASTRSTWGRRNAETSALRAIAGWRFRSPADREQAVKRVVDLVISQAVPLTPKNPLRTPWRFRTADGEDMFHPESRDLYTTTEVWDAEERLLKAGRQTAGAVVDEDLVDQLIGTPTGSERRILSDDQSLAVQNLLTSGRTVDVLVGPAGAGKTTSLEKLREIWETQHGAGSVRGLAPTARAAEVLADSLGIETENTAKWLHETARATETRDGFDYQLSAGDLMIVDEASIAGTIALDELRVQADSAGAKLLLVGDWAQLAAVDAGGAFGLLATDRDDVAELMNLHRFVAEWEADASKLLRLGKTAGLEPYIEHGRIISGLDETIVAEAVEGWKLDEATPDPSGDATLVSLLIAPTNEMVDRLNDIARDWRIEQGRVDATRETVIASGVASPGDRIVTRQNARTLRTDHDRWVKNNDEWVVVDVDDATGDIVAAAGEELVRLPVAYCRDHVQLSYATTAHRAQGRTVDTAHTIVDSSASRETFYVAMTRGKQSNRAYVVVDQDHQLGDATAIGMSRTWRETLEQVVLRRGGDIAAHDTLAEEAERIGSIRQLAAEYQTLVADQLEKEYLPVLADLELIERDSPESPYLGPVLANLRRIDQAGEHVPSTITRLLEGRDLGDARDVLAVLHYRLASHLEDRREFERYDAYAPMLHAFGIDVDHDLEPHRALRFYRTLAVVEDLAGADLEGSIRAALESIDRGRSRDLVSQLGHVIRRTHGIDDDAVQPPTEIRAPSNGRLIAGIIERAPAFTDAEFVAALEDRELAIQLRAEMLVDQALRDGNAWIEALGEPAPGNEADWRRRAVAVACYRDLYGVHTDEPLGRVHAHARNRERDRQLASTALIAAQSDVTFTPQSDAQPQAPELAGPHRSW